jgi:membrane fusion protein (multidrug efflux system)
MNIQSRSSAGRPLAAACAAACAMAGLAAVVGHWWIEGRHFESTDDAYVAGKIVDAAPRAAGAVVAIVAPDTRGVPSDARFKKHQLARLRAGQPVTLYADAYGAKVRYHGTVAGFSARNGAALTPQPAHGAICQWIKPPQRLPVRIALNRAELAAHPLRVGASMHVTVDVRTRAGQDGLVSIQRPLA